MSAICIFNLKNHNLSHTQLNNLANELVLCAVQNQKAVFFHAQDYDYEFIKNENMINYFLVSDSFLYKNCEILEEPLYKLEKATAKQTFEAFYNKFRFFEDFIKIICKYDVSLIEIYISTDGSTDSIKDFSIIKSCEKDFIKNFFHMLYDFNKNILQEFPSVKFEIERQ